MKSKSTRLFVNNLIDNISEEDLRSKFSNYGNITGVEVKERKNPVGNQTAHFAYVTLDIDEKALRECIGEFSNTKWKGAYVDVQVAKESFMERLKREREESSTKPDHSVISNGVAPSSNVAIDPFVYKSTKFITSETKSLQSTKRKVEDSHADDNAKRLHSLRLMKEGYRQQKQLIKNALSNIESARSNKIVFDDFPTEDNQVHKSTKKLPLFEGEGDDEVYDLNIPDELQGTKGHKLMQLQSRFKNDRRFKMDARFLEDDPKEVEEEEDVGSGVVDDEKEKQLEILESVLGKKVKRFPAKNGPDASKQPSAMLRFDPSHPEHSRYEVRSKAVEAPRQRVRKVSAKLEDAPKPPEVSKETFYAVESDLKQTLYGSEGFSLSKLFSNRVNELEEDMVEEYSTEKSIEMRKQSGYETNPFKYDSSEDEEGKEEHLVTDKIVEQVEKVQVKPRLWTETFFFKEDDYRLQEGFDFIKRLQLGERENFQTVRRNLKEIIRAKVKNNLRKNRPFKRKLGGGTNKKRIQVKKALKR